MHKAYSNICLWLNLIVNFSMFIGEKTRTLCKEFLLINLMGKQLKADWII